MSGNKTDNNCETLQVLTEGGREGASITGRNGGTDDMILF